MSLIEEIEINRKNIHTDAYPMSIGEIINLYTDYELDIHPEFQRIYRWSDEQKTKLIESILLGIPLPSVFVAQREDGVWDVIDGLQRLSTILSFMGILRDEKNKLIEPLVLKKTNYLPSLENTVWDISKFSIQTNYSELPIDLKRVFKREKIEFKIIKKESDEHTKYELFQRLNTGGSSLSDQEVRNCLLIMINHDCYDWLLELSKYNNFRECIPLTERAINEEGYMELALRFFIYRYTTNNSLQGHTDLNIYITDYMQILFDDKFDYVDEKKLFKQVFDLFFNVLGENSFKRYDNEKYLGPFVTSVFEVLSIGLSFNRELLEDPTTAISKIKEISKIIYQNSVFQTNTRHGVRATKRFINLIELGKELFRD